MCERLQSLLSLPLKLGVQITLNGTLGPILGAFHYRGQSQQNQIKQDTSLKDFNRESHLRRTLDLLPHSPEPHYRSGSSYEDEALTR